MPMKLTLDVGIEKNDSGSDWLKMPRKEAGKECQEKCKKRSAL